MLIVKPMTIHPNLPQKIHRLVAEGNVVELNVELALHISDIDSPWVSLAVFLEL